MFRATIRSGTEEPIHLSGEVEPYDLEVLRDHVRGRLAPGTRVEVRTAAAHRAVVSRALRAFASRGVLVVLQAA